MASLDERRKHQDFENDLTKIADMLGEVNTVMHVYQKMIELKNKLPTSSSGYNGLKLFKRASKAIKRWDEMVRALEQFHTDCQPLLEEERQRGKGTYDEAQGANDDKKKEKKDRAETLLARSLEENNKDERDEDLDLKAEFEFKKLGLDVHKDGPWTGQFRATSADNGKAISVVYDEQGPAVLFNDVNYDLFLGESESDPSDFAKKHGLSMRAYDEFHNKQVAGYYHNKYQDKNDKQEDKEDEDEEESEDEELNESFNSLPGRVEQAANSLDTLAQRFNDLAQRMASQRTDENPK
jgi:hypothetical protein